MKGTGRPKAESQPASPVTAGLIEDHPPDYVSTVTDETTKNLGIPRIRKEV